MTDGRRARGGLSAAELASVTFLRFMQLLLEGTDRVTTGASAFLDHVQVSDEMRGYGVHKPLAVHDRYAVGRPIFPARVNDQVRDFVL